MLQTNELQFHYPNGPALSFPPIDIPTAEHLLLIGASGSGKTTLLQLLGGLRRPKAGSIRIGATTITNLNTQELDRFRGQHIGIVFQQAHFVRSINILENLLLGQQLAGVPIDRTNARQLLERLQLGHKASARPWQLSVGEQQRAAIALALVNDPTLILADEPTSALDDYNAEQVLELLQDQAAKVSANLLIITHDNRLKGHFTNTIELKHSSLKPLS